MDRNVIDLGWEKKHRGKKAFFDHGKLQYKSKTLSQTTNFSCIVFVYTKRACNTCPWPRRCFGAKNILRCCVDNNKSNVMKMGRYNGIRPINLIILFLMHSNNRNYGCCFELGSESIRRTRHNVCSPLILSTWF